jgi:hypothetical protein
MYWSYLFLIDSDERASMTTMNSTVEKLIDEGYEFESTSYRWLILIFYALNFLGRSIANVGFVAIAQIIQDIYHVNAIEVTMLVLPFNIAILFLLVPYNILCNKYGMVIPTRLAVIVLIIGGWVRMLVNHNFLWLLLGQCIIAIGNPISLVGPPKIASLWFGDNQRAIATMLTSLSLPMGAVIGFVLPFAFIGDDDGVDTPENRDKIAKYILVQNIFIMVISIPIFFIVKNKPFIAPSISALKMRHQESESTLVAFRLLIKNKNYMLLTFSFMGTYITYICFGAVLGQISSQFGYKASSNQYFGMAYIICGVIGSMVHANLLDKHKAYKKQMMFIVISNLVGVLTLGALIGLSKVWITIIIVGFFGASQLPMIGIGYQFAVEVTYPINDNSSIGLLQLICCGAGIIYTMICAYFVKMEWKYVAIFSLAVPITLSFILQLFVKEDLRKHRESLSYSESVRSSVISDLSTED